MKEDGKINIQNLLFILGVVLIFLMTVTLLFFWKKIPPEIPWLYSLPWGEQQLTSKIFFAESLLGLSVFYFLTKVIADWSGAKDAMIKTTVIIGGLMMILLYATSFYKVLSIFISI